MRYALFVFVMLGAVLANAGESMRDLSKSPLTSNELKAYRAALSLAQERGQTIQPECVNASFAAGTEPVIVQFVNKAIYDEEASCVDPHFSIQVTFDSDDQVSSLVVMDN